MSYPGVIVTLVCCVSCLHAQDINPGPRITALGNAGVALQDIWSLQSNQAGLASVRKAEIAFAAINNFSGTGLSTRSLVFAIPFHQNVFGLSMQDYGFSEYSEQRMGFAYARSFGNALYTSLDFNIHRLSINQYGHAEIWSFEAGMQYRAGDNLIVGAHLSNPSENAYDTEVNAEIPVTAELGASFKYSENVLLNGTLVRESGVPGDFRLGIEYLPDKRFSLRGGISINPFRQYAGFGCHYHSFRLDTAVSSHPYLGLSPQIGISYGF